MRILDCVPSLREGIFIYLHFCCKILSIFQISFKCQVQILIDFVVLLVIVHFLRGSRSVIALSHSAALVFSNLNFQLVSLHFILKIGILLFLDVYDIFLVIVLISFWFLTLRILLIVKIKLLISLTLWSLTNLSSLVIRQTILVEKSSFSALIWLSSLKSLHKISLSLRSQFGMDILLIVNLTSCIDWASEI